ncbi:hypothetical protein LguiB_014438 [Lonicera macranthoides]
MLKRKVSRIGFGCEGLSGVYNAPLPHEAGCLILKEAFGKGITFFDTSDSYGRNDNKIMIGKALNLKRLDVDYIDLYYQHRVDVSVPIEDTGAWYNGIGIVAYSPLGRGFFGGKAISKSLSGDDIVPIPGTTKVKNLKNNIGSLGLKLIEEDLNEILDAVPTDEVTGEREGDSFSKYSWKFANTPAKLETQQVPVVRQLDGQNKEVNPSTAPPPLPNPSPPTPKVSTNLFDVLAFSGPALERINGRLAMIGFVAAIAVEASNGQDVLAQISNIGVPWFLGTSVVLTLASLVPLIKGISVQLKSKGLMTSDAEMWNGRFAMLGLVALACTEYVIGGAIV